jgi:hypothetical protein
MCAVETHMSNIYKAKKHYEKALHQEVLVAARHKGPGYSANLIVALTDMTTIHTVLKTDERTRFAS